MAASLLFLAAILSSYLTVLSVSSPSISQIGTETSRGNNHENHHLIRDLEKAKLEIARLGNYAYRFCYIFLYRNIQLVNLECFDLGFSIIICLFDVVQ